jgi:hypothetical protein
MESSCPGLIARLKGIPTIQRYKLITVFVDHYTRYKYVHMQLSTSSKDTLTAKKEFKALFKQIGVKILNYHADNGRFVDKKFIDDAKENGQGLTYCEVNALIQNGIAERRI